MEGETEPEKIMGLIGRLKEGLKFDDTEYLAQGISASMKNSRKSKCDRRAGHGKTARPGLRRKLSTSGVCTVRC